MTLDLKNIQDRLETKQHDLRIHITTLMTGDGRPASENEDAYQSLEDSADRISEADREVSVLANERALLASVHAALERLQQGTYGRCVDCGRPIPENRLNALPWAARDRACEALWEQRRH